MAVRANLRVPETQTTVSIIEKRHGDRLNQHAHPSIPAITEEDPASSYRSRTVLISHRLLSL